MRVIRTEFYFDPTDVEGITKKINPGVGVAFIHYEESEALDPDEFADILNNFSTFESSDEALINFIDFAVRGVEFGEREDPSNLFRHRNINYSISTYVYESEVVIEQSPPFGIPLKELGKKSAAVMIGSYLGFGLAGGSFPIMIITIPAGIIIVGAAIGVSRGLENGLDKAIQNLLKPKPRPRLKR